MTNFSYLATRPDLVPQFFEAGLIVLRAYQGLKRPEDVKATANLLARLFPALSPSLKTAPPDVLELMRKSKANVVEKAGAKVGIRIEGDAKCTRYLNGTAIQDGSYPVAPETPLYIFAECDGHRSDVWELRVQPGRNVVVPLVPNYGDQFKMSDDSFQSRRDAEVVLQSIAFWGGFEEVVGLRQPATQNTAPTLFGHLREGHVTWTETRDVPAFVGYVESTFDVRVSDTAPAPTSNVDWVAWSLVGGGALTAAGGVVLVLLANQKAQDIVCSGSAVEKPSAADCDGSFAPLTEAEFNSQRSTANAMRVGGFTAIGAGAALLTWGLWRFLDEDATVHVNPSGGGFTWAF